MLINDVTYFFICVYLAHDLGLIKILLAAVQTNLYY